MVFEVPGAAYASKTCRRKTNAARKRLISIGFETMADDEYSDFLCEYPFEGDWWGFKVTAKSHEEAQARLKQMPWAVVKGKHMMTEGQMMMKKGKMMM